MSKKPILASVGELATKGKETESEIGDISHLEFLNKKIILRIHYPSREVKKHTKKVTTSHTFDVKGVSYFIFADAFYRESGTWFCDYYFNNPQPIVYKNNNDGIAAASTTFKQKLADGKVLSDDGENLTYKDWLTLPYDDKICFAGVTVFDGKMINKAINHNYVGNIWTSEGIFSGKKGWVIFGLIIFSMVITAAIYYFRIKGNV